MALTTRSFSVHPLSLPGYHLSPSHGSFDKRSRTDEAVDLLRGLYGFPVTWIIWSKANELFDDDLKERYLVYDIDIDRGVIVGAAHVEWFHN